MKTTSKNKKNKDDLKKKTFSQFLLNLGANLSWGWLSSLRFFLIFIMICAIFEVLSSFQTLEIGQVVLYKKKSFRDLFPLFIKMFKI